jgi:hypothetical protein
MTEKKKVIYSGKRGDSEITYADGFFSQFGGLCVKWGATNCGFGEAYFSYDKERGSLKIDSEMMGPEFMSKVMEKLVRDALFTDFQEAVKSVEVVSLEQTNANFTFKDHVLHLPFHEEEDEENKNLIQMRWRIQDDKVLNVWFDKTVLGEKLDDSLSFCMEISHDKSFAKGFVKAEIWSWEIKEKN